MLTQLSLTLFVHVRLQWLATTRTSAVEAICEDWCCSRHRCCARELRPCQSTFLVDTREMSVGEQGVSPFANLSQWACTTRPWAMRMVATPPVMNADAGEYNRELSPAGPAMRWSLCVCVSPERWSGHPGWFHRTHAWRMYAHAGRIQIVRRPPPQCHWLRPLRSPCRPGQSSAEASCRVDCPPARRQCDATAVTVLVA